MTDPYKEVMLRGNIVEVLGKPSAEDKRALQKMIDEHFDEKCSCILEEAGDDDGEGDAYIVICSDQCSQHKEGAIVLVNRDAPPTMEPFGQRFVGIVDTYPNLSVAIVEAAAKEMEVYTRNNNVCIALDGSTRGETTVYRELSPEYAYVLFTRLQRILFGSDPNAKFSSKE